MTTIAVTGATGAMGTSVIETAAERADITVGLAVNRGEPDTTVAGIEVAPVDDLAHQLESAAAEVLIDFTGPASSVSYVTAAAEAGIAAVVGTTGFSDSQREDLRAVASDIPVLVAPNFARGHHALQDALRSALAALDGYDVEITETHHNRKRDAPSGTALELVDVIEDVRGPGGRTHGRVGDAPREPGEVGVHARRAGTVTGEHEVLLAENDESLQLVHRVQSRAVFAAGALDAAAWIADVPAGWYGFGDVLDDV